MTDVFLKVLNMSLSTSYLVVALLLIRLCLKRAPKWIHVALWSLVAFRLLCPWSVESVLSLIPSAEPIPKDIIVTTVPATNSGVDFIHETVSSVISGSFTSIPSESVNPLQVWIPILGVVWLLGVLAMLLYAAVSYIRLLHKVRMAVMYRKNIFESEYVQFPFILGIFIPKIYLPMGMDAGSLPYVLAHEQAHIRRKDHWWKPLGYLLLTLHWFNPFVWIAYILLCRDIELACDEKVVKPLSGEERANYSQALLKCSIGRRSIVACPLAFGEVAVKTRVSSVLTYKKPAFWVILGAVIVYILLCLCFLTDPVTNTDKEGRPILTLEEVEALQAMDRSQLWNHLENYSHEDTSLGYTIWNFPVEDGFYLNIHGYRSEEFPRTMMLYHETSTVLGVNLYSSGVRAYIEKCMQNGEAGSLNTELYGALPLVGKDPAGFSNITSWKILDQEYTQTEASAGEEETYLQVYTVAHTIWYPNHKTSSSEIRAETYPAVVTLLENTDGTYDWKHTKYFMIDGQLRVGNVRNAFPDHLEDQVLNYQQFEAELSLACEAEMEKNLLAAEKQDREIAKLLDKLAVAGENGAQCIAAKPKIFQKLLLQGGQTLKYCFEAFLSGGQTDVRGQVMALVCRELIQARGEADPYPGAIENGQEWFDCFRAYTENLYRNFPEEECLGFYPASWLLLQMTHTIYEQVLDFRDRIPTGSAPCSHGYEGLDTVVTQKVVVERYCENCDLSFVFIHEQHDRVCRKGSGESDE